MCRVDIFFISVLQFHKASVVVCVTHKSLTNTLKLVVSINSYRGLMKQCYEVQCMVFLNYWSGVTISCQMFFTSFLGVFIMRFQSFYDLRMYQVVKKIFVL